MAEYNTKVGIFETGTKDAQGGAYKDDRFLALRDRKATEYQVKDGTIIIGDRAFYDADKLETVILPEGVKAIGQSAFAGCKSLKQVNLPEGLEVIKDTVFRECESLATLTLPESLLEVGARAFPPGLKRLEILSENITFEPTAFMLIKALEEILVPEAACAKYTVWFVALGLTAKITEVKAEEDVIEEKLEFEEIEDEDFSLEKFQNSVTLKELLRNVIVRNVDEDETLLDTSELSDEEVEMIYSDIVNNRSVGEEYLNKPCSSVDELENYLLDNHIDYGVFQVLVEYAYFTSQGFEPEFDGQYITWPEDAVDTMEYEFYFPEIDWTYTETFDIDTL